MIPSSQPKFRSDRRLSLELLEPRVVLSANDLRITEFVASNDGGITDVDGDNSDWLEIYNAGPDAVDMSGMYLTDNAGDKDKWAFPAGTILPAGGYRIVFASDKNGTLAGGELHTNFRLSADGEYLGLIASDGVTVIDEYAPFPAQSEDVSYGRATTSVGGNVTIIANGAQAKGWVPNTNALDATWRTIGFNDAPFTIVGPTGFGYENNPGDSVNYTAEIGRTVPSGIASLYMRVTFNLATLAGVDRLALRMRYDDGFVAYINGELAASANAPASPLFNSQATTSRDDSLAEQFQIFDISAMIPELKVGANVLAIHGLNLAGGSDMLISPELIYSSAVLSTPERIGYFDVPTPGYANGSANFLGFAEKVSFSVPHGMYATPQSVALSSPQAGTVIVYTTDGSTPAVNGSLTPTNGTLYTGPINVSATTTLRAMAFKTDFKPSFIATSTYIFLDDVINQSPTGIPPAGWPGDAAVNGQRMIYGIDPNIISLYGATAVKNSLASIPSLSVTTDLANLFDPATGIYVNALNDGREWERASSVELINPDGSPGFSVNAGLRIRGGYSRNDFAPKHAFRFYFRGEYGNGKLEYPIFGDEGLDEYDVLDLRTEQNYSWSSDGSTQNTFLREVFSRDLQADLGDPYTRSRYYHLYIDGVYFGVYMTQERVEENMVAGYFGGEPEDYDIVKHGLNDGGGTLVDEGNDLAWSQLFTLAQNLANNPTANANNYWTMQGLNPDGSRNTSLPVLLDVDNLVNYMLIIFYTGGFDTGLSQFLQNNQANNWYGVYNRVTADRGFQFFLHDNEHSLGANGSQTIDRTGPFNTANQSNYLYTNPQYLHQDLMAHPEYRQRMIEKVQQFFFNGGPMTSAASVARMMERVVQVDPAIIAEAARWGDAQVEPPRNKATWQAEVGWLINSYFPTRTQTVIQQLRNDGLYVFPPTFSVPGGAVTADTQLTLSTSELGTIYYTTDGVTDPRLLGGNVNPSAEVRAYSGPITLDASQTIKARVRRSSNGAWSEIFTVSYTVFQAGDYALDGVVNGSDFLAWQLQLGAPGVPAGEGADGNRDGNVDGADLGVWQSNFGVGSEELAVVVAGGAESLTLPASVILDPAPPAAVSPSRLVRRSAPIDAALSLGPTGVAAGSLNLRRSEKAGDFRPVGRQVFVEASDEAAGVEAALDAALGDIL